MGLIEGFGAGGDRDCDFGTVGAVQVKWCGVIIIILNRVDLRDGLPVENNLQRSLAFPAQESLLYEIDACGDDQLIYRSVENGKLLQIGSSFGNRESACEFLGNPSQEMFTPDVLIQAAVLDKKYFVCRINFNLKFRAEREHFIGPVVVLKGAW